MWTRIFCSVKWNIGEKETTVGSFIWRKSWWNPCSGRSSKHADFVSSGKGKSARRVGTGLSDTQYLEAVRDSVSHSGVRAAVWRMIFGQVRLRKGTLRQMAESGVRVTGTIRNSCYAKGSGSASKIGISRTGS